MASHRLIWYCFLLVLDVYLYIQEREHRLCCLYVDPRFGRFGRYPHTAPVRRKSSKPHATALPENLIRPVPGGQDLLTLPSCLDQSGATRDIAGNKTGPRHTEHYFSRFIDRLTLKTLLQDRPWHLSVVPGIVSILIKSWQVKPDPAGSTSWRYCSSAPLTSLAL